MNLYTITSHNVEVFKQCLILTVEIKGNLLALIFQRHCFQAITALTTAMWNRTFKHLYSIFLLAASFYNWNMDPPKDPTPKETISVLQTNHIV